MMQYDQDQEVDSGPVKTVLFPAIESLDIFLDGDWRDRPASEWAIRSSGTLQAKIEQYKMQNSHRRPQFLREADQVPLHVLIKFANTAYGYNGWSTEILETKVVKMFENTDPTDATKTRHTLAIESTVKVSLRDGTYHESVGMGFAENMPTKSLAFGKAKKESITAATKRCLQGFGELVLEHENKMKKGYYKQGGMFDFIQPY